MTENEKFILEWHEKLKSSFSEASQLLQYLTTTMDNFYYRYIETEDSKDLKTQLMGPGIYGAVSFESNLVQALKSTHPEIKKQLIEFAKSTPKSLGPRIRYLLKCEVKELKSEQGHLILTGEISWDFPDFKGDETKRATKEVNFKYSDLTEFRKKLALKLEEVCEIFL